MIKSILFDVHGTIIYKGTPKDLDNARMNVVNFLNSRGYNITYEDYLNVWLNNLKKHRKDYEELNEVSFYGWYSGILSDLNINDFDEEFINEMNKEFMKGFRDSTRPTPYAKEVLKELKKRYLLGIVSNSLGINTRIDLSVTGLIEFFDNITISSDVGKRKPHSYIFKKALDELGIRSEEAVFVGDSISEDIRGAKGAGMKSILIEHDDPFKDFSRKDKDEDVIPDGRIRNLKELIDILKRFE
jgi:putative hydrolase of the HAD superfamily